MKKYLWHHGIPYTNVFKGQTIKDILEHSRRRITFLRGVTERLKQFYMNVESKKEEERLRWMECPSGKFSTKKYVEVRSVHQEKKL